VVAAWEKDIDRAVAKRVLDGEVKVDLDEHLEQPAPAAVGPTTAHA
jgi:hypothetical protein